MTDRSEKDNHLTQTFPAPPGTGKGEEKQTGCPCVLAQGGCGDQAHLTRAQRNSVGGVLETRRASWQLPCLRHCRSTRSCLCHAQAWEQLTSNRLLSQAVREVVQAPFAVTTTSQRLSVMELSTVTALLKGMKNEV